MTVRRTIMALFSTPLPCMSWQWRHAADPPEELIFPWWKCLSLWQEAEQIGGRLTGNNVHSVKMILPDGSEYRRQGEINFAASQIDPQLGTQQLRATFENSDHHVLPGQFVRVRIAAGEPQHVFLVPQTAVMSSEFGRYVYLVGDNNTVTQRPVVVGDWIGTDWIVLDGLQAGDKVAVDNLIKLMPGKAVNPQPLQAASPSHADQAAGKP